METIVPADSLSATRSGEAPASARRGAPDGPCEAARNEARAGLYVHVPFCATRCAYCDFASGSLLPSAVERWSRALALEAAHRAPEARGVTFTSVFFGGGTPSAIPPAAAAAAMATLRGAYSIHPRAEITLEANPESVDDRRLETWRAMGVNRLSFGAQTFDPAELEALGRIHDPDAPARAVRRARRHGFERLSIDLMFGFPGHSADSWRRTVDVALALEIEHLSAYAFIPEGGTPLGNAVTRGEAHGPGDDAEADLYDALVAAATAAGFVPYETSNFCRPGAEARHNLTYWLRRACVALGPSAHGLIGGARYANPYGFERWAAALERGVAPDVSREPGTPESVAQEILFLGLRLARGIEASDHEPEAWSAFLARYASALDAASRAGRVERTAAGWRVPPALRFVADDAIAWIEARAARSPSRADAPSV